MDSQQFGIWLADLYAAYGRQADRLIIGAYFRRLAGYSADVLTRAAALAEKDCQEHPPSASVLLAHCKAVAKTVGGPERCIITAERQIEEVADASLDPDKVRAELREKLGINL